MHELNPGSSTKLLTVTTGEVTPDIMTDDLLEVDSYKDTSQIVRLVLNTAVNRAYVEVEDKKTLQLFAIPISPGQNTQKIFNDPFTYLRLAQLSVNEVPASEVKVFQGREDNYLLEELIIPETPKLVRNRRIDGIDVSEYKDAASGKITISVFDTKANQYFSLEPRTDEEAEEMFGHPYTYLGRRGVEAIYGIEREDLEDEVA